MIEDRKNEDRANQARFLIAPIIEEYGGSGEELETVVSDFLCDLMHMNAIDGESLDLKRALNRANFNFEAER